MDAARYWELTVTVSPDASEGLTNFLWELGALGVIEEELAGQPARLRAFFHDTAPSDLERRTRDYVQALRALGLTVPGEPRVTPRADEHWAEAWRAHFRPLPVGRRLVIVPPWATDGTNGRMAVVINPGRAFGTGHHGSTAGCLELIESVIERECPAAAIDLGTGSGILAIALARLGVPHVLAVDQDPDAVANAIANAARNAVSDRVRCVQADAGSLGRRAASLVVANLLGATHVQLAGWYRERVSGGGTLVLGGLLDGEAAAVTRALTEQSFETRQALSVDGWTALELSRAQIHDRR